MLKYAKIIDNETKKCEVGTGTNAAFYIKIGMKKMDVEQSSGGSWYLSGYVPDEMAADDDEKQENNPLDAY